MLATSTLNQAWVSLLFAGGFVYFVINGVITGSTIVWYRRIERSENPFLFWFSIVSGGMGAVFFDIVFLAESGSIAVTITDLMIKACHELIASQA